MTAVLVTGSAGFIGQHLTAACVAAGWTVTGVDLRDQVVACAEHVRGDAAAESLLVRVRRGEFEVVLHQAAISDTLESRVDVLHAVNVAMPLALARACAIGGARFIYASSGSVYGSVRRRRAVPEHAVGDPSWCTGPLNAYARSKLQLEQRVAELPAGLSWAGLRYTNVFGPGEAHKGRMASILSRLLRDAVVGQPLTVFVDTLAAARDFLPVGALVTAVLRLAAADVPAGVYNLGAGHAVSFATLLEWCSAFGGGRDVQVRLTANPGPDRYQYWTCADMTRLRAVLPAAPAVTPADVRAAAETLYRALARSGAPA